MFSPMSVCLFVGWFVSSITQKLLNGFQQILEGGRVSIQDRFYITRQGVFLHFH